MDLVESSRPDRIFPAIAFGFGDKHHLVANKNEVSVCYTVEENEYNGRVSLQLGVKDMK